MDDTVIWWKKLECHYHPSWNLHEIRQKDLNTLKDHVSRDVLNEFMVVERLLYAAFLEVPVGSFYNLSFPSTSKAHEYLDQAEEYVKNTYEQNEDARLGYGIVINACRMWIGQSTRECEKKLQELKKRSVEYPKHKHYMSAVQAFTYSKLGSEWLQKAFSHYETAIKGIDDNSHWLFETAFLRVQLARLEDPTMKSEKAVEMLIYAQSLVRQVLNFDNVFHAARALLVQILSDQGNLKEAEKEAAKFTRDVIKATAKTNIAEILCKFYIKIENYKEATDVITKVPQKYRTAEEHFLRGYLNKMEAESQINPDAKWKSAFLDAQRAIEVDTRHYSALCLRAEMNVKLMNYGAAKEQYKDLLTSNLLDKPQLRKDKFRILDEVLSLPLASREQILTEEECINYSSELLNIAVSEYTERNGDGITFQDFSKGPVENCKSFLKGICERKDIHSENCFLAKLKLAHFHLQLQQYDEAEKLYKDLKLKEFPILRENVEVMWGLFKCRLSKELYEEAEQQVDGINDLKTQTFYRTGELYADIYTTIIKSQLLGHVGVTAELVFQKDDNDPYSTACLLKKAVERGSLEACFMFFKIDKLHEHFLEFMRIPNIVATIQRVNNKEIENVHTDFPIEPYVNDRDSSITTKRKILKENVEKLLTFCVSKEAKYTDYQNFTISNVFTKLSKLREDLLKFEVVADQKSKETAWGKELEAAFSVVLLTARFLLDHIVSDYQDALIAADSNKPNSYFCIIYDHENGTIDKEEATKKLNAWLENKFPNCHLKVSPEVKKSLLEIQPMYAEENLWLIATHYYVNALKHQGGRKRKIKPSTKTNKTAVSDLLKDENKENLARTSCKEVEKIVLTILAAIKEVYKSANQEE